MRTQNSLKNIKYGLISQMLNIIIQFVSRTFFVQILGKEYLGINGLFTNVLTILSLADLGINSILIYSMYNPLLNKDIDKIKQLMNEYKKIYTVISGIVLLFGLALIPFLRYIINDVSIPENIYIIYLLYLINSVVSYLCIYKISILNADQKEYIITIYQQIFNIISNIIMLLMLYITHNFILYLTIKFGFSIVMNVCLSKKAVKLYPEIANTSGYELSKVEKNQIYSNAFAMIFHKIGGVIVNGTDNIILSSMVSITAVGIYSNYLLIISAVKTFSTQFFNSMTASVGNLVSEKNNDYSHNIFRVIFFLNFIVYSFCTICLFNLLNRFIALWLGLDYLFENYIVFIIVFMFFVDGMRISVQIFRNSMGIFKQDKYRPLFEAVFNIVISIILVKIFGISGVFLGTILSMLLTCVFIEPYFLFRDGFKNKKNYLKYCLTLIIYYAQFIFINFLISFIIKNISYNIFGFILSTFITVILSIIFLLILNFKTSNFKLFLKFIKDFFARKRQQKNNQPI